MRKILILLILLFCFSAGTVFAEDLSVCPGKIEGQTTGSAELDEGVIYFDTHQGETPAGKIAPNVWGLIGGVDGIYAPAQKYAACVGEEGRDHSGHKLLTIDVSAGERSVEGWAWNDNLGFVSFFCVDDDNLGVPCGDFDYGVKIGEADGDGDRELSGYAWNPTFGYISMDGVWDDGAGKSGTYGVVIDKDGKVKSGSYAWTNAKMYIDFEGVTFNISKSINICVSTWANEDLVMEGLCEDEGGVVANGKEGIDGCVCDEVVINVDSCEGATSVCVSVVPDPELLSFVQEDEVGNMMMADYDDGYGIIVHLIDGDGHKIERNELGFLMHKVDLEFVWIDTVDFNQVDGPDGDFSENKNGEGAVSEKILEMDTDDFLDYFSGGADGKYELKDQYRIKSYAPTSNGNVSFTTSTTPAFMFRNEGFLNNVDGVATPVPSNDLILKEVIVNIRETLNPDATVSNKSVYPNGRQGGVSMIFAPIVDVYKLYANDEQDIIQGVRDIPVKFVAAISDGMSNAKVTFILDEGDTVVEKTGESETEDCLTDKDAFDFVFEENAETVVYSGGDLGKDLEMNGQVEIAETDGACNILKSPSLYSVVEYTYEEEEISYFSNKLPRLAGGNILNPSLDVWGSVYSQVAYSSSSEVSKVNVVGDAVVNVLQNVVVRNIRDAFGVQRESLSASSKGMCIVNLNQNWKVSGSGCSGNYSPIDNWEESGYYFSNVDVMLIGDHGWSGKKALIVDGGNLFISKDLYNGNVSTDNQLAVAVMRGEGWTPSSDYGRSGNVYLSYLVNNVQANIYAEGAVFPWDGYALGFDDDGHPGDLAEFFGDMKKNGVQLKWEGSISSANTIGGSNQSPMLGRGNKKEEDKLVAQLYDLNFLRIFAMQAETGEYGYPVDQSCGKALSPQDLIDISNGDEICGSKLSVDNWYCKNPGDSYYCAGDDTLCACDGLDFTGIYDSATNPSGDLMVSANSEKLAQGLEEGEYGAGYVRQVETTSALFRQAMR